MNKQHYTDEFSKGVYQCKHCGAQLFSSHTKFHSGTLWPSFRTALPGAITTRPDHSFGMVRTEIVCGKCGQHLGHVFDDGKEYGDTHPEAGQRFCVLSETLDLKKK